MPLGNLPFDRTKWKKQLTDSLRQLCQQQAQQMLGPTMLPAAACTLAVESPKTDEERDDKEEEEENANL